MLPIEISGILQMGAEHIVLTNQSAGIRDTDFLPRYPFRRED
jgi:hypothetical protein